MRGRHQGTATLPLHGGRCPAWLFPRMQALAGEIVEAIVVEFGPVEVLRRLADPYWFQALGSVLGFDWHSSGVTTTVCGALKEALRRRGPELGIFVAGGKGATSRQTPREVEEMVSRYALAADAGSLVRASRLAAKVDNTAIQDGFQIYHHTFIFTRDGQWAVVQQGMNGETGWARRYHWLSTADAPVMDFTCEPEAAVCCDQVTSPLNLVAREGGINRQASVELVREKPERLLRDYGRILAAVARLPAPPPLQSSTAADAAATGVGWGAAALRTQAPRAVQLSLAWQGAKGPVRREAGPPGAVPAAGQEMDPQEFPPGEADARRLQRLRSLWLPAAHAVPQAQHLERVLLDLYSQPPQDFTSLLARPGVGPRTLRALALMAEVIYGAPASFRDPVRYSFAHGGKDGTPFPVDRPLYDRSIETLRRALEMAHIGRTDKIEAFRRLAKYEP